MVAINCSSLWFVRRVFKTRARKHKEFNLLEWAFVLNNSHLLPTKQHAAKSIGHFEIPHNFVHL
jgi:hypothetical protein